MTIIAIDPGPVESVPRVRVATRNRKRSDDGLFLKSHGLNKTPEYNTWRAAIQRCFNPNCEDYPRYGGRGITMCESWRKSFLEFLAAVGKRPAPGYTLDRKDNARGYEPGNCRWASKREQNQNRRDSKIIEFRGERLNLIEWSRKLGIDQPTLWKRLKGGWSIERALTEPVANRGRKK